MNGIWESVLGPARPNRTILKEDPVSVLFYRVASGKGQLALCGEVTASARLPIQMRSLVEFAE